MNYIQHLSSFYDKLKKDNNLNTTHVSLYHALFQLWNLNHFQNPIIVFREQVIHLSRIGSLHTYYKCLNDLHCWGYIQYIPSSSRIKGSTFFFNSLESEPKEVQPVRKRGKNKGNGKLTCNDDLELPLFEKDSSRKINDNSNQDNSDHIRCKNATLLDAELHQLSGNNASNKNDNNIIVSGIFASRLDANMHQLSGNNASKLDALLHPFKINNININSKTKRVKEKNVLPIDQIFESDFEKKIEESVNSENVSPQKRKRKKVAQKKEKPEELELPFATDSFVDAWKTLITLPKWKNKTIESLRFTLKKLAVYEVAFATILIELAITNNWKGAVFVDTEAKYQLWKQVHPKESANEGNEQKWYSKSIIIETNEPERNYKDRF